MCENHYQTEQLDKYFDKITETIKGPSINIRNVCLIKKPRPTLIPNKMENKRFLKLSVYKSKHMANAAQEACGNSSQKSRE